VETASAGSLAGLLLDFGDGVAALRELLVQPELRADSALDAFLLAAGLNQIVDESVHRPVPVADRVARAAPRRLPRGVAGVVSHAAAGAAGAAVAARQRSQRRTIRWQRQLVALIDDLVDGLAAGSGARALPSAFLDEAGGLPPTVRDTVVRPPTSFSRLDQRPADVFRLARIIATGEPDRQRPVLVVGVRTSGSYLAPLYAGALRAAGFPAVRWLAIRPRERRLRHERERIRTSLAGSALVLVADDPPKTGGQLDQAARELLAAGVSRDDLLLPILLNADAFVPPLLQAYNVAVLPWSDWAIHSSLRPERVRADLERLLEGRQITVPDDPDGATAIVRAVTAVEPVSPPETSPRGHVRQRFRFRFVAAGQETEREQLALVEGVGLGRFSLPWLDASRTFASFFTEIYGVADGVLYRAATPSAPNPATEGADPRRVAEYAAARRQLSRVRRDPTERGVDGRAVWKRCARLVSTGPYLRPLVEAAVKRLLRVREASIVDRAVTASAWIRDGATSRKTDLQIEHSYDAIFSLAVAAADRHRIAGDPPDADAFAADLRQAYEELSGDPVPPERWLLYQLLEHHEHVPRLRSPEEVLRTLTAIEHLVRDYLAGIYMKDLVDSETGELCALDVDGVLESRWLSAPSTTPLGAAALRALSRHGYRVVLASGRSALELRARCRAYRLAGAVAEYGGAMYVHDRDEIVPLLDESARRDLSRVRARLRTMEDVYVDPRYEHAVRAYRLAADGELLGLRPDELRPLLDGVESIRAIEAVSQTDFVADAVSKATGLRALARELDAEVALAVGNSTPDLPMFAVARTAYLTANANPRVRAAAAGVRLLRDGFQAGVVEAVEGLLGHRISRCDQCAAPRPSEDAELLLTLLSLRSARRRTKLHTILRSGRSRVGRRPR
jgi:hydroxymethylpyrimidine pyrophosphatase-like HAD family hydrolase